MASEESCKNERERTGGLNPMQSWDCSQIENEEEEESWQERDQKAEQWKEEQHLEDIVERRRREGSSLKLGAMQEARELVVHGRMAQGKKGEKPKRKEESTRMVYQRNEGKAKFRCGGRHGGNEKMEKSEPERDGPMLEEVFAEYMEEEVLDK